MVLLIRHDAERGPLDTDTPQETPELQEARESLARAIRAPAFLQDHRLSPTIAAFAKRDELEYLHFRVMALSLGLNPRDYEREESYAREEPSMKELVEGTVLLTARYHVDGHGVMMTDGCVRWRKREIVPDEEVITRVMRERTKKAIEEAWELRGPKNPRAARRMAATR